MKKIFEVPVSWEVYGVIKVEANSKEEAIKIAKSNLDDFSLPTESFYVDDSFDLSSDNLEELKAMTEIIYNAIETNVLCPQCEEAQLIIQEEGENLGEIIFSFDGIVEQEIREDLDYTDNFLIVDCPCCDANFEINYDNELVYWELDLKDYVYRGGEWIEEVDEND